MNQKRIEKVLECMIKCMSFNFLYIIKVFSYEVI